MSWRTWVAVGALAVAGSADAQSRGSAGSPFTSPVTKSAGGAAERANQGERELPIEPRHGVLASPGSAPDAYGPTRLGPDAARPSAPMYGEAAKGDTGTVSSTWHSGDRIRSYTSADVRSARQQQAPDLEITPPAENERQRAVDRSLQEKKAQNR